MLVAAVALFSLLSGPIAPAQSKPDFSGRWVLVLLADDVRREAQTLGIEGADEILIRQSASSVTVEHPSKPGTHPRAATHVFGSRGTFGAAGEESGSDIFWFGDQLLIGKGSAGAPDSQGRRYVVESGEMWSLDDNGRLEIECIERRSGTPTRRVTLTYKRR